MLKIKFEYRITVAYLLGGGLWILFSDNVLNYFVENHEILIRIQMYKGWFFVLFTAYLLLIFLKKHLKKARKVENSLMSQVEEYLRLGKDFEWVNEELLMKNSNLLAAEEKLKANNEELHIKNNELLSIEEELRSNMEELFEKNRALEASEERFRQLSSLTFEGILIHNKGVVIDVNDSLCQLLDYDRDELVGTNIIELVGTEDLEYKYNSDIVKLNKGLLYLETEVKKKNGDIIPIELHRRIAQIQDKEVRVVAVRDISSRKAIEKKFKLLFENMTSGFALHEMIYDEEGKAIDYRFLEINPAFQHLTGLNIADALGKTVKEIMPDTENYWIETYDKVASTGVPMAFENYSKELDKYFSTYIFSPQKGFFATTFNDVSDRVLAEKQVRFQEESIRKMAHETSTLKGEEFLNTTVLLLNEILRADYTFIGILNIDSIVNTLALCHEGAILENFSYELTGTPCHEVLNSTTCIFSKNVARQFPDDQLLIDMGIEAYAGSPFYDKGGKVKGIIVSLYKTPIEDTHFIESLFELFADRIGHEIERSQTEKLLKDSEERYRLLFDNMTEAFALHEIVTDDNGKPINYIYREVNKEFIDRVGMKREDLINKNALDLFPNTEQEWIENFGKVALTGQRMQFVNYSKELDNYYDTHVYCPKPGFFASIFNDVTEKVKTEEALRLSEERFILALKGSNDGMWDWNLESNQLFYSERWKSMLGYEEHEIENSFEQWEKLTHPDDLERAIKIVNDYIDGTSDKYELEFRLQHKEGHYVYILSRGFALRDTDGKATRLIGTHMDLTERNMAEAALKEKVEEYLALNEEYQTINEDLNRHKENLEDLVLIRTRELESARDKAEEASMAKGEFISNMSHELRTPLNAILGYAQILKRQANITIKQKENLQTIYGSGAHLLELINDILDFGKIESHKIEIEKVDFNLNELFQSVINIIKIKAEERNLYLNFEAETSIRCIVETDQRRLKQILLNLLGNAVKYTNEGGVEVSVKVKPGKKDKLIVKISDTGIGIPEDKLDSVFEAFVQAKGEKNFVEGTGLGLPITKKLVELLGGKITLISTLNQGSVFKLVLPIKIMAGDQSLSAKEELSYLGYAGESQNVLLVDDNKVNLGMLKDLLEPLGFHVHEAVSAYEAISIAKEQTPDLIILDFLMPDIDGLGLLELLAQNKLLNKTKIIGVSATVTDRERKNSFVDRCHAFLSKPIEHNLLLGEMGKILPITFKTERKSMHVAGKQKILSYPSGKILSQIIDFAEKGSFVDIENVINQLDDNEYGAFIKKIYRGISKYDDDSIIKLCKNEKN